MSFRQLITVKVWIIVTTIAAFTSQTFDWSNDIILGMKPIFFNIFYFMGWALKSMTFE